MDTCTRLVIPDLFLPPEASPGARAGLHLPALEKILARAKPAPLAHASLEEWLCAEFGAKDQAIAPITLQADGLHPGEAYWLRADPVHLILRGDQLILHPVGTLDADEARQLCDSLNRHFAEEGLHFAAPQPQHWYLRLGSDPGITTHPLARVAGKDIHAHLPQGSDALEWHRLLNEIQMLLFGHPVNQAREARGEWLINSVWLWGGGRAQEKLLRPFERVYTDNPLAAAFAQAAGISQGTLPDDATPCLARHTGETLIVWDGLSNALQRGDIDEWRESLQQLERNYASLLLGALRTGRVERIMLDVPAARGSRRFTLTRCMAWRFWRRSRRLEHW